MNASSKMKYRWYWGLISMPKKPRCLNEPILEVEPAELKIVNVIR